MTGATYTLVNVKADGFMASQYLEYKRRSETSSVSTLHGYTAFMHDEVGKIVYCV